MIFRTIGLSLLLASCSVEKVNLSPTSNLIGKIDSETPHKISQNIVDKMDIAHYFSQVTNAFSEIPTYSKNTVNEEISILKFNIMEYFYAIQEGNALGEERALADYKNSYRKLQKLKQKLSVEEEESLNRFLVNVKTNISLVSLIREN